MYVLWTDLLDVDLIRLALDTGAIEVLIFRQNTHDLTSRWLQGTYINHNPINWIQSKNCLVTCVWPTIPRLSCGDNSNWSSWTLWLAYKTTYQRLNERCRKKLISKKQSPDYTAVDNPAVFKMVVHLRLVVHQVSLSRTQIFLTF